MQTSPASGFALAVAFAVCLVVTTKRVIMRDEVFVNSASPGWTLPCPSNDVSTRAQAEQERSWSAPGGIVQPRGLKIRFPDCPASRKHLPHPSQCRTVKFRNTFSGGRTIL